MATPLGGQQQPTGPPSASSPVGSVSGLAQAASLLLVVMAVVCVVGAGASVQRVGLYDDVLDLSQDITRDDFVDSEKWVLGGFIAYFIGQLVTGVVFICWQYRHARNAQALGGRSGLSPGWAIGGWFVPIAYGVVPGIELFQSSKASTPVSAGNPSARGGRGNRWVLVWMVSFTLGTWIMSIWVSVMRPVNSPPFETIDLVREGMWANQVGAFGFTLLAVAAGTGAAMVRSLTRHQSARIATLMTGSTRPPVGRP